MNGVRGGKMSCSGEELSFRAKVHIGEKRIETRRMIRNVEKNILGFCFED